MGEIDFEAAKKALNEHGQGQLLRFWQQLNDKQRQNLLSQIAGLDLDEIDKWVSDVVLKTNSKPVNPDKIADAPYYPAEPENDRQKRLYKKARSIGTEKIAAGKVAAFVVAGGQGTRLGFDGPKGNFPISPVKNKSLFQLFAEQIAAVSEKYNVELPWYVMTSPLNHKTTVDIFGRSNYYGLKPENVFIFQQGTLPNFSMEGKILLADKDKIACSPDGHGGSLKALYKSGAVEDMRKRGVEFISYFQVDNPLINIFDPLFIGLHVLDESGMSSKTLIKAGPKEKVGNFCLVDGMVTVIEYSDLPDELAYAKNDDGSYVFRLGSIAIHMISVDFVERLNSKGFALPLHRAVKKIPHIDAEGKYVKPEEPNGIKLETFVFDALPLAENSMILQTIRENEFAPVKNASGVDSAETSRAMMTDRWARWLEAAGVEVPRKQNGKPDVNIEIAAGFALDADELKAKRDEIPPVKSGDKIYLH